MNRKIGMFSALLNTLSVALFAISMLIPSNFGSYLSSMFIALSFIPMMCAFCVYSGPSRRAAGVSAAAFSAAYAVFILAVYFTQVTTVAREPLTEQAAQLLDYTRFGLFFSLDLLGYALMALATFFAGLTLVPENRPDKWLKSLLLIHGVFFISCFIMPMLGIFSPDMPGAAWIGTAILEFWCVYFIPVGILSLLHFRRKAKNA